MRSEYEVRCVYIYIYIYIYMYVCVCVCVCKGGNSVFGMQILFQMLKAMIPKVYMYKY